MEMKRPFSWVAVQIEEKRRIVLFQSSRPSDDEVGHYDDGNGEEYDGDHDETDSQYNYENVILQLKLTDLHIGSIFKSSERELEKQYLSMFKLRLFKILTCLLCTHVPCKTHT